MCCEVKFMYYNYYGGYNYGGYYNPRANAIAGAALAALVIYGIYRYNRC